MRKLLAIFTMAAMIAAVAWNISDAANPTVTTTRTDGGKRFFRYSFTFSTSISTVDTAIIGDHNGRWFDVGFAGDEPPSSPITVELKSSETTADSNRHIVMVQFSSAASPSMTNAWSNDWITAFRDSAFDSVATAAIIRIQNKHRSGVMDKMRLLIYDENDTTDATQTVTGRLLIPRD